MRLNLAFCITVPVVSGSSSPTPTPTEIFQATDGNCKWRSQHRVSSFGLLSQQQPNSSNETRLEQLLDMIK
jgi:hypothetical protein